MIQYGSDTITELVFTAFHSHIEPRDEQWIDIELDVELAVDTPLPADLTSLTVLVVCAWNGTVAEIVPLDEGCDCEFQFTASEKAQIASYIEKPEMKETITNLSSPIAGKLW